MSKKIIRKFDVKSKYICVNERTKFKIGRIKRNFFPGARFCSMTPGPPLALYTTLFTTAQSLAISQFIQCNNCTFYTTHFDFTIAPIVINCTIKYALINGKNTNTLVVLSQTAKN